MNAPYPTLLITQDSRRAFSLLEMTFVASLLAVGSAVAVPRWNQSVERTKVTSMRQCVETNIDLVRRLSVRRGREITLSFAVNSGKLTLSPAMPDVLGDTAGVVDFSDRFRGVKFSAADFNGNAVCKTNLYGELVSVYTDKPLTAGLVSVACNSTTQSSDLLVAQGQRSTATLPGAEETPPTQSAAAAAPTGGTSSTPTSPPATSSNSGLSSLLQKMLGW